MGAPEATPDQADREPASRVDAFTGAASIVWSASMSHTHRATTNNQAEYQGLLAGLRAAQEYDWPELEVVGDSQLILTQLRRYQAPRNPRLRLLYTEARRLADKANVTAWTHQVRAYNKMADLLANFAMDSSTSSQVLHPTTRSGHVDIPAT